MVAPVLCAENNTLCIWTNAADGHVPPNAASSRAEASRDSDVEAKRQ